MEQSTQKILAAYKALKPIASTNKRSNMPIFKSSIEQYAEAIERSTIAIGKIPFVMAQFLGTTMRDIQDSEGYMTDRDQAMLYEAYIVEINAIRTIIKEISKNKGGFYVVTDLQVSPSVDRIVGVLKKHYKQPTNHYNYFLYVRDIHCIVPFQGTGICMPDLDIDDVSDQELDVLLAQIHLVRS